MHRELYHPQRQLMLRPVRHQKADPLPENATAAASFGGRALSSAGACFCLVCNLMNPGASASFAMLSWV